MEEAIIKWGYRNRMDDLISRIVSSRDVGVVHCGLSNLASPSLVELAEEFGLFPDPATYREIEVSYAMCIIQGILHQDLAYDAEIMPASLAAELAEKFLGQFDLNQARFYTNGHFFEISGDKSAISGTGWTPATPATFDTGVLAISSRASGCIWVEDED
jgi:hypothetical protein